MDLFKVVSSLKTIKKVTVSRTQILSWTVLEPELFVNYSLVTYLESFDEVVGASRV